MKMPRIVAWLIPFSISLVPALAVGASILPDEIVPCSGLDCSVCDIAELAQNLLNGAIVFSVFAAAILFAYAGWLYLTNEAVGQQQKAKGMLTDVTIGLVILLAAWVVVDTLMKMMIRDSGNYLPWNNVCAV